jgi:hypothetical protein
MYLNMVFGIIRFFLQTLNKKRYKKVKKNNLLFIFSKLKFLTIFSFF